MYRYLLLICLALLDDVTAKIPAAPGEKKCSALKVGAHVITDHSCTSGPSDVDTVCSFECPKGYQRNGPGHKRCQLDGSWTNGDDPVKCDDVNECDTANGFCSHLCVNKPGSYKCKCPPPLILDPKNQRKCKGPGVQLTCDTNHMEIVLPKNLIHNLHHEHLSLIDPSCRANGNATHYSLSTDITKCGTTSHVYKNFIVYTNRVIESPNEDSDVITHVGVNEIKVPFSCYFNDLEIVHTVGYKPVAQKIHVYVKGRGEYALSLDIFKDESYGEGSRALAPSSAKYTQDDFPIEVHLRERVFVQASLDTREKDLKIFASNCCSTPMQDHEATMKFRHALIVEGCPRDPTVQFHSSSDPTKFRFSFEAFQFLGNHDYVFIHCRVHVCDVNDNKSRCAKGCLPGFGKPPVQDHPGKIKKAQTPEKLAQPNGKSVRKVVASGTSKKAEVRSASKKSTVKAAAKVLVKAPSITKNKVQDQPKVSKKTDAEIELRHLMKRAAATRFQKRGVLGSTDLTSIGPVLLEHAKRNGKREPRPKKVFADAKGIGMNHDVKQKNKRTSVAPSATNIVLVALTVASIMALVGVAYLGRKATKIVNNPYNYDSLAVYQ